MVDQLRQKICAIAKSRLGEPWQHNQSAPRIGTDCLRFWETVAKEAGLKIPPIPAHYGWVSEMETVVNYCQENFIVIAKEETEPGDLVILSYNGHPHLAIADWIEGQGLALIHCSRAHKKVVRHGFDESYKRRWLFSFRVI